jgi:biotin carboxylase
MEINSKKPVAIVLGGSTPHIPLLQKMKEMGYYCVLLDYLENPVGKPYADIHHQINILDRDLVLEQAIRYKAEVVITLCLDRPISVACYVSEKLGLKIPYSYKTSELVTNKLLMKEIMVKNKIPTSKHITISEKYKTEEITGLSYPLIIKPIDSTGSLGVVKVENESGLQNAIEIAFNYSASKNLIIEEFVGGVEWNMYFFIKDSNPNLVMVLEKSKHNEKNAGLQQVGSYTIRDSDNPCLKEIQKIAKDVIKAFSLTKGPLLIQAKVNDKGISVIEIAARLGGTALSNSMMKELRNIDIVQCSINSYLGLNIDFEIKESEHIIVSNFLYAKHGKFKKINGLNAFKEAGTIREYFILKNEGDIIPEGITSKNRVGAFFVSNQDINKAFDDVETVVKGIDVLSTENNSILYKDIYVRI